MLLYYLFILVVHISTIKPTNGWETPSSRQYHIQTDEGPERYFRYQTDSGQYRKEKRLEDGTVIGTYAWIDDNGFLRQRDYIADNAGYRILKSKNLFVGRNMPVGDAVKAAKKYPASAGTLVGTKQGSGASVHYKAPLPSTLYLPSKVESTTAYPIISTTERPYINVVPNGIASTTPSSIIVSTEAPVVEITPNSVYSSSISPILLPPVGSSPAPYVTDNYISSTPNPSREYIPPSPSREYIQQSPSREYIPVSPSGQYVPPSPTLEYIPPSQPTRETIPALYSGVNQVAREINNGLEYDTNPYVSQRDNSYRFQNGPTYPLDQNGKTYVGQNIGNGYDPQYPTYDGVSVTNDGFRYYIPRAYHEEQTLPGDKRSGSFGYIDPFGIRRVIYYNTAPGSGFQHRKNNRYVGFQATPYDPRPLQ